MQQSYTNLDTCKRGARVYLWQVQALYLTYDGLLDPLGQSQILPYLRGIQKGMGVTFSVISFEKRERWQARGPALAAELKANGIDWHPRPFSRRPPLLAKLYDQWQMDLTARRILRGRGVQLLHARSYVAGWSAHKLHRATGIPWIFDMRGFWADERKETGTWPQSHPFYRWLYRTWKAREKIMLSSAVAIVVLTEAAKAVLREWGLPPEKITVIPCVADYEHFRPDPSPEAKYAQKAALDLPPNAFVLGYVGSIGPLYALEEMFRFFRVLLAERPESYMVFFTPAPAEAILPATQSLGIPTERLRIAFAPRESLPQRLACVDGSIIFCRPGFSRVGSSPTRIAELLALNIPVVAQAELGDNRWLAERLEGLFLCEELSEAEYRRVVRVLLEKKHRGDLRSPRDTSQPFLSLPVGLERYVSLYERLLTAAPKPA